MVMAVEILLVLALIGGDYYGAVPVTSTPFFVALGWASLRLRGLRWRDVGFVRPPSWGRALVVGTLGRSRDSKRLPPSSPLLPCRGSPEFLDLSGFQSVVGNARACSSSRLELDALRHRRRARVPRICDESLRRRSRHIAMALDCQPRRNECALRLGARQSGHHRHRAGNTVGSAVRCGVSRLRAQPRDAHHRARRVEYAGARADLLQSLPGCVTRWHRLSRDL